MSTECVLAAGVQGRILVALLAGTLSATHSSIKRLFDLSDSNREGSISFSELHQLMRALVAVRERTTGRAQHFMFTFPAKEKLSEAHLQSPDHLAGRLAEYYREHPEWQEQQLTLAQCIENDALGMASEVFDRLEYRREADQISPREFEQWLMSGGPVATQVVDFFQLYNCPQNVSSPEPDVVSPPKGKGSALF